MLKPLSCSAFHGYDEDAGSIRNSRRAPVGFGANSRRGQREYRSGIDPMDINVTININTMLVDDIDANRKLMSSRLSPPVVEYATAEEAVAAANSNNYHLIIMNDEFGPDRMTSTEAIKAIRDNETTQGISDDKKAVIVYWTVNTSLGPPPGADFIWPKDANAAMMQEAIDQARERAGY